MSRSYNVRVDVKGISEDELVRKMRESNWDLLDNRVEELKIELKKLAKEYYLAMEKGQEIKALCLFRAYQARRKEYIYVSN